MGQRRGSPNLGRGLDTIARLERDIKTLLKRNTKLKFAFEMLASIPNLPESAQVIINSAKETHNGTE